MSIFDLVGCVAAGAFLAAANLAWAYYRTRPPSGCGGCAETIKDLHHVE